MVVVLSKVRVCQWINGGYTERCRACVGTQLGGERWTSLLESLPRLGYGKRSRILSEKKELSIDRVGNVMEGRHYEDLGRGNVIV